MALSWSRRRDDEPDHPEHVFIAADVSVDPTSPGSVVFPRRPMESAPFSKPDGEQDPDIIEPSAVFKPCQPLPDWSNVEITVEYHD